MTHKHKSHPRESRHRPGGLCSDTLPSLCLGGVRSVRNEERFFDLENITTREILEEFFDKT